VWKIFENELVWFQLQQGEYVSLEPDAMGVIRSPMFPGLWLAVPALLGGDMQAVLAVLQAGLQFPEHAAFTQRLAK
jgi:hypothetical protein